MGKTNPTCCQGIYMWRLIVFSPVTTKGLPAHIISHDQHNIRFASWISYVSIGRPPHCAQRGYDKEHRQNRISHGRHPIGKIDTRTPKADRVESALSISYRILELVPSHVPFYISRQTASSLDRPAENSLTSRWLYPCLRNGFHKKPIFPL